MKTLSTILAISMSVLSLAQKSNFKTYVIDVEEEISACKITANVNSVDEEVGSIQSIQDNVLKLKAETNISYNILINNWKEYHLQPNGNNSFALCSSSTANNSSNLLFRIQIGAFKTIDYKNNLPDNLTLYTEKKENSELTRVMAGEFHTYKEANDFLSNLKYAGYVDSFIVSYQSDRRISTYEAMKLEKTLKKDSILMIIYPTDEDGNNELSMK